MTLRRRYSVHAHFAFAFKRRAYGHSYGEKIASWMADSARKKKQKSCEDKKGLKLPARDSCHWPKPQVPCLVYIIRFIFILISFLVTLDKNVTISLYIARGGCYRVSVRKGAILQAGVGGIHINKHTLNSKAITDTWSSRGKQSPTAGVFLCCIAGLLQLNVFLVTRLSVQAPFSGRNGCCRMLVT